MQDEISRMSKKELERALRSQLQNGGPSPKKNTITKSKRVEEFTAEEWVLMRQQSGEALAKMGVDVISEDEYAKAQVKIAERNFHSSISLLAFVLTRILDAYQSSKTHSKTNQLEQLKAGIKYIGEFERGGRLDKQLDTNIANAKGNLDIVTEVYQALGYDRDADVSEADLEQGRAALQIASAFRDGTKKLLDGDDQGQSLITTIDTYKGDIQRLRGTAMQDAAPDYGGRKRNEAMNADILDTVGRLGLSKETMSELAQRWTELGDPEGDKNEYENFKKRHWRLKTDPQAKT